MASKAVMHFGNVKTGPYNGTKLSMSALFDIARQWRSTRARAIVQSSQRVALIMTSRVYIRSVTRTQDMVRAPMVIPIIGPFLFWF